MRHLLIISPYFAPVNAADMQRVRMSLPHFKTWGWAAEVVAVDPEYTDAAKDEFLTESVPGDIKMHWVKALPRRWTAGLGLGSIALRSMPFYRKTVNRLLENGNYDLIYFSTTQFPVCILGAYWKKRFNIPYIIDMQDPWHSDYYQDKPRKQRPSKYWFSYRLNKYLEPLAMKSVGGLISVSEQYIADLKQRYPQIAKVPAATIPFGCAEDDMGIALRHKHQFKDLLAPGFLNIVYIGRGGADMEQAIVPLFSVMSTLRTANPMLFNRFKLYFIGTSYAPAGQGTATILPIAEKYGIGDSVVEITARISFYHTLVTLELATALFIPGSDDPKYSASKIFPYLLTKKPLLSIFHECSPAIGLLRLFGAMDVYGYQHIKPEQLVDFLENIAIGKFQPVQYDADSLNKYSAKELTREQCFIFDRVIDHG